MKDVSQKYVDLQEFVENTLQKDKNKTMAKVFIKREKGIVFLVKMVEFDLIGMI